MSENKTQVEENLRLKLEIAELKMMVLKLQHQLVEVEWNALKNRITTTEQGENT